VRKIGEHIRLARREQLAVALSFKPGGKLAEIAAVTLQRIARQPLFEPQRVTKLIQQV